MSSTDLRSTPRAAFPHFCEIATRWMDNDVYGHVNNVVYYSYFDTAVNQFLIERGVARWSALWSIQAARTLAQSPSRTWYTWE